jgi:hypothetical protein
MHGSSNPDQMKIVVPTEEDWGDYQSDLDRKYAHDLFAGHTNEEMRPYFRQNPIERASELRWMPELPFRYYMIGFQDCLMDGDFDFLEASNAANCFLNLILEMLENQPQVIIPIMRDCSLSLITSFTVNVPTMLTRASTDVFQRSCRKFNPC